MDRKKVISTALLGLLSIGFMRFPASAATPSRIDAPRTYITDAFPLQVIPMNLDEDEDLDAAVLTAPVLGQPRLQLFENPGDGTLVSRAQVTLAADTRLAWADLNGDTRHDLVQVHSEDGLTGNLLILTRTGAFSFSSHTQTLSFPCSHVCIGDLDGQHGPDLVIGDDLASAFVQIMFANGAGGYVPGPRYETEDEFRDVNGDGLPETQSPINVRDCRCEDMNGDGSPDLVVVNSIQRRVSPSGENVHTTDIVVLLNDGTGALGPYQPLLDWGGDRLGIDDVDADTDLDIVSVGVAATGGSGIYQLVLLRNFGNATFAGPQWFATDGGVDTVWGAVLDDVDGDGDPDAGVMLTGPMAGDSSDHPTDFWALLRNDGTGHFGLPEPHPTGADIFDLAFADLDGESGPEALTIAADDDRLVVDYNRGGWYPTPRLMSIDDPRHAAFGNEATDLVAGDFNNDGDLDLAALATVSGSFGGEPDDIIAVLPGGPLGPVGMSAWLDVGENPWRLHAEGMAGSPATDLGAVFLGDSLFAQPMGVGLTTGLDVQPPSPMQFTQLPGMPSDLTALEVTGDGVQDLAVLRSRTDEGFAAGISIVEVSAVGGMTYLGDLLVGSDDILDYDSRLPEVITSEDMDGDGWEDMISVTWNVFESWHRKITVIRNTGNLQFWLVGEFHVEGGEGMDLVAADVTGDDRPDVVLVTAPASTELDDPGYLWVLPNLGGGMLGDAVQYNVGEHPRRVAAGRIDTDDALDLIVASDASNEITLLINDGHGAFPVQERYVSGGGADALAVGDWDGDGDQDIAAANDSDGMIEQHANVSLLFNRAVLPPTVAMDLDKDGDVDQDDLHVWLQCASGPCVAHSEARFCYLADLDMDGDVDQQDFGIFQRCYSGENIPADPDCAE